MSGFMFREMFDMLENLAALLATVLISRHGFSLTKARKRRSDALRSCRPAHSYRILKQEKIAAYGMGRREQLNIRSARQSLMSTPKAADKQPSSPSHSAMQATIPAGGLLRESDVRRIAGIAHSTLYRWVADGRFPRPVRVSSAPCAGGRKTLSRGEKD
jgi:predicted DNA-binding transcriptional regulator AlpA